MVAPSGALAGAMPAFRDRAAELALGAEWHGILALLRHGCPIQPQTAWEPPTHPLRGMRARHHRPPAS